VLVAFVRVNGQKGGYSDLGVPVDDVDSQACGTNAWDFRVRAPAGGAGSLFECFSRATSEFGRPGPRALLHGPSTAQLGVLGLPLEGLNSGKASPSSMRSARRKRAIKVMGPPKRGRRSPYGFPRAPWGGPRTAVAVGKLRRGTAGLVS